MPKAILLIRRHVEYRTDAFEAGLKNCGYTIANTLSIPKLERGDLVVSWNRHSGWDHHCKNATRRGASIIVVENGYIGAPAVGGKFFAMALDHHNGAGRWPVGGPERFLGMGVELKPWRQTGDHILILPQRGIGEPGIRQPPMWAQKTFKSISNRSKRKVRVRLHPGRINIPLEPDLVNCWAAVVWASGAGIKAIAAGIPVFHDFDKWIGAGAATRLRHADFEKPFLGDRLPMFERLAWSQYSIEEITSGFAFRWLLGQHSHFERDLWPR